MCNQSGGLLIVLLAFWSTLQCRPAAAVDAPHGAYLGCFNARGLSISYQVTAFSRATLNTCGPSCAQKDYGLIVLTADFRCYCSNTVPTEAARLRYADCLPGKTGVALFYLHKDARSIQCRLSNPPMSKDTWKIAYGQDNVEFNTADNTVAIKLSNPTGARLESKDGKFQHGMYQVEALVSGAAGVVSSFYTRSSDVYPNEIVPDFSEIDWEWCNAYPCEKNTIWLNSLTKAKSHGEHKVPPAEYQSLLGTCSRPDNAWTTYTLDWQPDYVAWSVNGTLLHISRKGQITSWTTGGQTVTRAYESPDLASMQVISIWTDTRPAPSNFGGVADLSAGPFYSYFRHMRRVLCDQNLPVDPVEAALALGPAWLYGSTEANPLEEMSRAELMHEAQDDITTRSENKEVYDPALFDQTWYALDGTGSVANIANIDVSSSTQSGAQQSGTGSLAVSRIHLDFCALLLEIWLTLALRIL